TRQSRLSAPPPPIIVADTLPAANAAATATAQRYARDAVIPSLPRSRIARARGSPHLDSRASRCLGHAHYTDQSNDGSTPNARSLSHSRRTHGTRNPRLPSCRRCSPPALRAARTEVGGEANGSPGAPRLVFRRTTDRRRAASTRRGAMPVSYRRRALRF